MNNVDSRESLESWIERNGITMDAENIPASERPGSENWQRGARHFHCTLRNPADAIMHVYFSQGPAVSGTPDVADVLDCLANDISFVRNAEDRWDFMEQMGGASKQNFDAWDTIREQEDQLETLVGSEELDKLVWETERL